MPATLSVGIVTFDPDPAVLAETLSALDKSARIARDNGLVSTCKVSVVSNGPPSVDAALDRLIRERAAAACAISLDWKATGKNLGYGSANNLAIHASNADYHLILNPDVFMDPPALSEGLAFLAGHPNVVLVTPQARDESGRRQYLCKAQPSAWVLLLRGFAPPRLQAYFGASLARYEMRSETKAGDYIGQFLASGCFMLGRTALLKRVGGFDPGYFMYFEDFDLSKRLAQHGPLAFTSRVTIVHAGGDAAAKGWRHRLWFVRSAVRFFQRHGWRAI